jgi:hypothetical protein
MGGGLGVLSVLLFVSVAGCSSSSEHKAKRRAAATATAVTNRPALAVKIENSVAARLQTGLNSADLVWEEVVEGGITRYVAVYQSRIPAAIDAPLKGVLAYSGGAQRFIAQADAHHRAVPPKQFAFALPGQLSSAAIAGSPANALALRLSPISPPHWTWDAAHGRYLRSEGGNPTMTADAGRIAATNVVVLRVKIVVLDAVDAAGTHVPETVLSGSGAAVVASAGKAVAATWSKGAVGAPMSLVGRDGQPVELAPGNTWVELVPNGSGAVAVG